MGGSLKHSAFLTFIIYGIVIGINSIYLLDPSPFCLVGLMIDLASYSGVYFDIPLAT